MNNIKTVDAKLQSMGFEPLTSRYPRGKETSRINEPRDDRDCRLSLFFGKQQGNKGKQLESIHVVSLFCIAPGGIEKEWNVCNELKGAFPEARVVSIGCCKFDK